jgi:quercetin dioxygenase-like cupin family protein
MGTFNDLKDLDHQLRDAEMDHNSAFFESLLSNELVFRRASGKFVNKTQYLHDLPQSSYYLLESTNQHLIPINNEIAYTINRVVAAGKTPNGVEFDGTFINVRFFRLADDKWNLYAWHNTIASNVEIKDDKSFTGTVSTLTLLEKPGKKDYEVFFHPGARTYWHIHTQVQKLFIVSGEAIVVMKIDGKDKYDTLSAGEHIRIPPGVMHWHGASPDTFMIHIASNSYNDLPNTYWFNEVMDDECHPPRSSRNYSRSKSTI